MRSSDLQHVSHILRYCEEIDETIKRFGESQALFFEDLDCQKSISMSIMQIGELTIGLSDESKYCRPNGMGIDSRHEKFICAYL